MKVDNPNAYRFILQDELYLLPEDKVALPADEFGADNAVVNDAETVTANEHLAGNETRKPVTPVLTHIAANAEPEMPKPSLETRAIEFNYLGGNNKNFAILVNYATDEHIPAAHLIALESILKRKELSLADVAIFNIHQHQPMPMAKIAELLKPVKMAIMGKEALPQGIGNLLLNSPVQGKKTHVLYSFSFNEMMSSNENKKAFWDQMKTL